MPAGFRRHLVGKTRGIKLGETFVTVISLKLRFVGELVIVWTFP